MFVLLFLNPHRRSGGAFVAGDQKKQNLYLTLRRRLSLCLFHKNAVPTRHTINTRAFLGTPFRLRDDVPRDSITQGLNGTICIACGGTCLCGEGLYIFQWRGSGVLRFVRDAFGGDGILHLLRGRGIRAGFDFYVVHPTPSHTSHEK